MAAIGRFQKGDDTFHAKVVDGKLYKLKGDVFGSSSFSKRAIKPSRSIKTLTPVEPSKVIAVGLNYADHARESNLKPPTQPLFWLKAPTSLIPDGGKIDLPFPSHRNDFEAELAIVIGLGVFFISASFQYGNNLGVHYAFEGLGVDFKFMVVVFNAVALVFLFAFKNLYQAVERMMMVFVGLMLVAFAANLIYSGPNLLEFAKGLVPGGESKIDLSVLALVGTTFVVTAAFYQSYLVRQKGWGKDDLRTGILDARVGAGIMAVITLVLMSTAATLLYPTFHKQMEITVANDSNFTKGAIVQRADFDKPPRPRHPQTAPCEPCTLFSHPCPTGA